MFHFLVNSMSFGTLIISFVTMTAEQKKRLFKAKIAVVLQHELGRVPKQEEIEQVDLLARVIYKAILGLLTMFRWPCQMMWLEVPVSLNRTFCKPF
jgi:hypothetical protein